MKKNLFRNLFVFIMLSALCITNVFSISSKAQKNNSPNAPSTKEEFKFRYFTYIEDINLKNFHIKYDSHEFEETYYIYDENNILQEKITVSYPETSTRSSATNTKTAFFTRDKAVKSNKRTVVTVRFTACVTLYSNGSFRSFESLQYTDVGIMDQVCSMELENSTSNAWSNTGKFPCTQLDFAYTAHLMSTVGHSTSMGSELLTAGFSFNTYYRKTVNSSGSFRLYNQ